MDKGTQGHRLRNRILIVEVNWIGDVLFSTPFIRAVRKAYPESYIACLVHPRCKDMLDGNVRINDLILYDEEGLHKSLMGKLGLVAEIKKRRFDTAFLLHRSFTKALLTYLAGIKERIGYSTKNRGFVLTQAVKEPSPEIHKVEYFLELARAAGIKPDGGSYEFYISDPDRRFIKELLAEHGVKEKDLLVTICPGGNWDPKRWPKGDFARIADEISMKFGARVAIAGAKKDAQLAEDIKSAMKTRPIITSGRTTLKELGALLERSGLVIANDTGPMHMSVAMKTKTIALFGPTSAGLTGPYGEGEYSVIAGKSGCAVPCYDASCKDYRCMSSIKPGDVLKKVASMLEKAKNGNR